LQFGRTLTALGNSLSRADAMASSESNKITMRQYACQKEIASLVELAGIKNEVERAVQGPIPTITEVPFDSEEGKQETERYWEHRRRYFRLNLRKAVFSVRDVELRRLIIDKHYEYEEIMKNWFKQEALDCKLALEKAESVGNEWWIYAATLGVLWVALGYHFFAIAGAIAGAVVAFFQGRYFENDAKLRRDSAVAKAREALDEANKSLAESLNQSAVFSQREKNSGQPEP
jgi:hypothetical protein